MSSTQPLPPCTNAGDERRGRKACASYGRNASVRRLHTGEGCAPLYRCDSCRHVWAPIVTPTVIPEPAASCTSRMVGFDLAATSFGLGLGAGLTR